MYGACKEGEYMTGVAYSAMQCSYAVRSSPPPSAVEVCPEAVPCQAEAADSCGGTLE